ncbi:MAG TPA: EAL domain-containing protein, partial [Planctomycetota bacterium]|nr:EAL domain-containing protein [Planctomycetota bacterium]
VDGRVAGVLGLHSEAPGFFTSAEMKLLNELAGDISFALDHLSKADRILYLAKYDALTGLPNRRLFGEDLTQRLEDGKSGSGLFAVVLVDMERFGRVNETLGRAAGDELLREAAARLQKLHPTVARIGVDLFAFPVADKHSVSELAHAVDEVAARCFGEPFVIAGETLRMGCRAGIAVCPSDGRDAETLLRNAEAALRRAKTAAQHCVFYAPEMNARVAEALALESRLRHAIERQEFVLHYQPKVSLPDGRICGLEALIRWQHPEHGLVPPLRFISVLEEAGLIGTVGRWALRQALADHRRWRDAGLGSLRVAVNVSPLQLREADFAAQVREVAGDDGGEALELEITENVIMENMDRNVAMLKDIRSRGVTVAIDDFGTGYSSLAYIAKLPATSLKIDRAFVTGMSEGPHGMVMVSSIIALAHALKLKVVAEGVETEEQSHKLSLLSCDEAQGYLFSRPVTADEIEAMLRSGEPLPLRVTA